MVKKKKQDETSYIFNEWKPNLPLLTLTSILWTYSILQTDIQSATFFTISALFFAWSIGFSKKIKKET